MESYILRLDVQLIYQVLIQLIVLGIICTVLFKFLYKPVTEFLDKRKERIEKNIADANDKLANADTLKAEYEIKLQEIEKEKTSILEEARLQAKRNETMIIEEAKIEAETIKNRANLDIEREKEKAKEEIKLQIVEVSNLIASKFITENISVKEQEKLIDQVIGDLGEIKWQS